MHRLTVVYSQPVHIESSGRKSLGEGLLGGGVTLLSSSSWQKAPRAGTGKDEAPRSVMASCSGTRRGVREERREGEEELGRRGVREERARSEGGVREGGRGVREKRGGISRANRISSHHS